MTRTEVFVQGNLASIHKFFLREDDVTALAGAAAYRGPQNFNCVSVCLCVCVSVCLSVCLCIARSPDWRGLETSDLLEEFRLNF